MKKANKNLKRLFKSYREFVGEKKWAERTETSRKIEKMVQWARKVGSKIGTPFEI